VSRSFLYFALLLQTNLPNPLPTISHEPHLLFHFGNTWICIINFQDIWVIMEYRHLFPYAYAPHPTPPLLVFDQMQKRMASLPIHIRQCSQIIDYTNWHLIILTMTDNYQYFQDYSKHFWVLTQINGLPGDVGGAETGNPFPPPVLASALCRMSGD